MNARTQNGMRVMVAAMMLMMVAATVAAAKQSDRSQPSAPRDPRVNARVVAKYGESSWLMPQAVVLDSEQAWDEWNAGEVSNGRAVGTEKAPKGVAWGRECLLVVALGENLNQSMSVTLTTARRNGSATEVHLDCNVLAGGSSPSVVVALPRSAAHDVKLLTNLLLPQVPERATYVAASTAGDPRPVAMAVVTWGSLKSDYR